ncbi:DNA-deoxyinosine glycosylase [Rheinheimera lutimaris]|uniref:DNA-deoxyinosine glycosylase n=1 Tax=Rheinheimera lutimaris TaxID=2740584 RepID=UPI001E39CB4C|nr:DNA-deoxyinosine glycosylase [Rheinheimera lutimaris]
MAEHLLTGLAPLSQPGARVLVLGSMPGAASLTQQQYYAHPRNLFWPVMAELAGFSAALPYDAKVQALTSAGVALWDVIGSCRRAGSLDSAIRDEQVNDFAAFFAAQPQLLAIGFNGAKALQSFKRHVLPQRIVPPQLQLLSLPSTSPAHAALGFNEKLQQWRQLMPFIVSF